MSTQQPEQPIRASQVVAAVLFLGGLPVVLAIAYGLNIARKLHWRYCLTPEQRKKIDHDRIWAEFEAQRRRDHHRQWSDMG